MTLTPPKALLFDLGGVLVDIDFGRVLRAWAPYSALPLDELTRRFGFDLPYQRHERGEICADAYFDHVAQLLQLSASREAIEAGWNAVFIGEIADTCTLLEAMRARLPCYAFTNTNASHMAAWSRLYPRVVTALDRIFASHQMGMRKPEPAAFAHIAQQTGLAPHEILFFDDLHDNVAAAIEAGFQAVHVRSPADVRQALLGLGDTRQTAGRDTGSP